MDKRSGYYIALIIITLVVGVCIALHVSDIRAAEGALERAETVLRDSANEDAEIYSAAINGHFETLQTIADTINQFDITMDARAYLDEILDSTSFKRISFAGLEGVTDDAGVYIGDRAYFQDALNNGRGIQRVDSRTEHASIVALSVAVKRDGVNIGVVCGYYDEETLRAIDKAQPYGGAGYSLMTDGQGIVIFVNESEHSAFQMRSGDSLERLAEASFKGAIDYQKLRDAMAAGESGAFHMLVQGTERVVAFVPFQRPEISDAGWYIFDAVSESELKTEIQENLHDAREQFRITLAFTVLAAVILLLLLRERKRERHRITEEARIREERFRIAVQQSERALFEYDIANGSARVDTAGITRLGMPDVMADFECSVLEHDLIAEGSRADFQALMDRVRKGESPVKGDLQLMDIQKRKRWFRFNATTLFSDSHVPKTAIISYYDCTEQREREMAYARWQQELEEIPKSNSAVHEWNLTKNLCEAEHSGETASAPYAGTFEKRSYDYVESKVYEEDREACLRFFDRAKLLGAFHGGVFEHSLEFREVGADGGVRWIRASIRLVPYPDSTDVKAYVILRDIDQEKRAQIELRLRSETDPMTGVLNRAAFQSAVENVLRDGSEQMHVLMMLDIDHFKAINDTLGHDEGDRAIQELVKATRSVLRVTDIFGRVGGDEFMVCLPDIPFETVALRRAEQIREGLYRRLPNGRAISVSVGIAISPRDGDTFGKLYKSADIALYYAKKMRNRCEIYSPGMREERNGLSDDSHAQAASPNEHATPKALLLAQPGESSDQLAEILSVKYDVCKAENYRDALISMDRFHHQPCAVLLDMDAPFAEETLRAYGSREDRWRLPLVALMGSDDASALLAALRGGAIGTLRKPVSPDELLMRMEALSILSQNIRAEIEDGFERLHAADESRVLALLEATGTAALIYDPQTRQYDASLMKKLDFVPTGFDGRSLSDVARAEDIVSEEDMQTISALLQAVLDGEKEAAECTLRCRTRRNGRRWFRVRVVRENAPDALVPKLLLIFHDVNESYIASHPDIS